MTHLVVLVGLIVVVWRIFSGGGAGSGSHKPVAASFDGGPTADPSTTNTLESLEDAGLGRALSAMHEQPQHCFSLPELAELAGTSRSVFAVRFAHAIGQSPIEFLKALRLARAAALLARTDLPVKGVAARVGYASRSSFGRAFCHGLPPAVFRTAGRRSETKVA